MDQTRLAVGLMRSDQFLQVLGLFLKARTTFLNSPRLTTGRSIVIFVKFRRSSWVNRVQDTRVTCDNLLRCGQVVCNVNVCEFSFADALAENVLRISSNVGRLCGTVLTKRSASEFLDVSFKSGNEAWRHRR